MQPSVAAILLTANRPEMTARAVKSFESQTYENKRLLVYNTGYAPTNMSVTSEMFECWNPPGPITPKTIGSLRNAANGLFATTESYLPDILIHFDSDDVSHATRIAEQVDLLQSSGADVCGYNEVLFWRESILSGDDLEYFTPGEAWLYTDRSTNRAIGSSLCYRRAFWENHPFADGPKPGVTSEYWNFIRAGKTVAVSSIKDGEPRLIARIHGGNANIAHYADVLAKAAQGRTNSWARADCWDKICRERMMLL